MVTRPYSYEHEWAVAVGEGAGLGGGIPDEVVTAVSKTSGARKSLEYKAPLSKERVSLAIKSAVAMLGAALGGLSGDVRRVGVAPSF